MNTLLLKFIAILNFYIFSSHSCNACYFHFVNEAKKIHSMIDFINCIESFDTINHNSKNKNQINDLRKLAEKAIESDIFFEILENEARKIEDKNIFTDKQKIFQAEFFNILKKVTKTEKNQEAVWIILSKLNTKQ